MIKVIALLKKKEGLTREQFKDYYEHHHVPLACTLLPMAPDYRRSYPVKMRVNGQETDDAFPYDAVSEAWFEDEAGYQAFAKAMQDPETYRKIAADEERFLDRSAGKYLVVEEMQTKLPR